jgi:hypothetical protein
VATRSVGSSRLRARSNLPLSLLPTTGGMREGNDGSDDHHHGEVGTPRMTKCPLPGAPNIEVVL